VHPAHDGHPEKPGHGRRVKHSHSNAHHDTGTAAATAAYDSPKKCTGEIPQLFFDPDRRHATSCHDADVDSSPLGSPPTTPPARAPRERPPEHARHTVVAEGAPILIGQSLEFLDGNLAVDDSL